MTPRCHAVRRRHWLIWGAWLTGLVLCIPPAQAREPHATPVVFDATQRFVPSQGYSLDARSEERDSVSNPLIGYWEYKSEHGTITLEVLTDNVLVLSGHEMKYELRPGVIHMTDEGGTFDYPYQLANDRLILTTVDGESAARNISFRRVDLSRPQAGYLPEDRAYH